MRSRRPPHECVIAQHKGETLITLLRGRLHQRPRERANRRKEINKKTRAWEVNCAGQRNYNHAVHQVWRPATKRISLAADGSLISDGSACVMARGTARRVRIIGAGDLGALIERLQVNEAITLGALRSGLDDPVEVVTKRKLDGAPNVIARTGAYVVYRKGQPALALFDFDSKGMPDDVAATLRQTGGFWSASLTVLPELQTAAHVTRRSTSAGLFRADTGMELPGSDGVHIYVAVRDGTDIERSLKTLHERCWLAGLGWMTVGAGGQLLERSIIDRMVGAPERLVFEGGPILEPPLQQDKESRRPIAVEGDALDTLAACPPLTIVETARLRELKAKWSYRLAGESAKARAAFIAKQAKHLAEAKGISLEQARQTVARQCGGVLLPDVVLPFDDADFAGCTVAGVIADPDRFEGATLADPLEGVEYGTCKARVMRRADGSLWVHSFAHGRTIYELKLDAAAVRTAIERASKEAVVKLFVELVMTADLNAAETEELRNVVVEKSGLNRRTITDTLKAARRQRAAQQAQQERERRLAERRDPRPQIKVPPDDAPWLPQVEVINEILGRSTAAEPPMRDIDGVATWARKLSLPGLHAFTDANETETVSKLPAPEQWLLQRMNEIQAAEMIERHIDYVDEDDRSVHLPTNFVRHYITRDDGVLPTVVGIATLPLVLADGSLLAPQGLDRARGIIFKISNELRAALPKREDCNDAAVKKAMEFLCDEWQCDVATDFVGKCTLIALDLTMIERSLLPDRPAFWVIAGKRGGGKTTTLQMFIMAATGERAAAAAWSMDEEERRKALLAYFLSGVAYILWDNIGRGSQISCPHIERSCTSAYYSDRRLGFSEMVTTAAASIHLFTGNNVGPKGDLASRSLRVRLVTDRPDPENREFRHPDPVGWTETHRAEILRALYTILLGNPTLSKTNVEMKTRFKVWWRLVGSAVEHAAQLVKEENADLVKRETVDRETREKMDRMAVQDVDFKSLFLSQEEDDEDSASLADALDVMRRRWVELKASDITNSINKQDATSDLDEKTLRERNHDSAVLRDFLYGNVQAGFVATPKSVAKRLQAHIDEPVRHGGRILVLRTWPDRKDVAHYYVHDVTETGGEVTAAPPPPPPRPKPRPAAPVVEPITAEEMDELKRRGFSGNDLFDMNPKRAREIIADPRYERLNERFAVGAKTAEPCLHCLESRARMITFVDRCGRQQTVALHLKCAPIYYEEDDGIE